MSTLKVDDCLLDPFPQSGADSSFAGGHPCEAFGVESYGGALGRDGGGETSGRDRGHCWLCDAVPLFSDWE
jgi:hypothetical protein